MSRRELGHGRHRRREDEQRRETIGDETIRGEKRRQGYYGQFTSQIHEKEIEKRGKYIQWHEKSSCTCLEFYFCKVDVRNTKPRSTIFEVPNIQFSRISQVLQLVLQLSFI